MAIYSLKQRIFIVKRYYQNGNSTEKVKNEFTIVYNDNKPTDENIVELVELFENFGSVLLNNDTQIKLEINADSIKLEGDPQESSYNNFEIKSEEIDNALSCEEMDPLKCSETASDGNLTPIVVNCDNPKFDVSIGVKINYPMPCGHVDECPEIKNKEKTVISEGTNDKDIPCSRCNEKFKTKLAQSQHMIEKHAKQCGICNKKFRNLDAHMAVHTKERLFQCTICNLKFGSENGLKRHIVVHSDEKPCACNFPGCSKSFKTKCRLLGHKRTHLTDTERPFKCEICHKGFLKILALKLHVAAHAGEKHFVCNVCGAPRSSKNSLMNHMRIHTGDKAYEANRKNESKFTYNEKLHLCDICGKSFGTSLLLYLHKKNVHAEEKPYECKVCGSKYTNRYLLKRHMRIHTGEKPYSCAHCLKVFTDSTTRRRHERTHTGEKPYECGSCGKSFNQPSNLKAHMNTVKCSKYE